MIDAWNPCSSSSSSSPSSSKTHEIIMSKYRPIAPKPEAPSAPVVADGLSGSHKIRQNPYLENIWTHLQARPTRTRKRGRLSGPAPRSIKRQRPTPFPALPCSPFPMHTFPAMERPVAVATGIGTHPLLTCPMPLPTVTQPPITEDFVKTLQEEKGGEELKRESTLEEKDLQLQLKLPGTLSGGVVSPYPIRPVGSIIKIECMINCNVQLHGDVEKKRPEAVEEEVEAEELPAIISDSNNKVRMANSAYKEMVGQPECLWLDSMANGSEKKRKRISGEVVIHGVSEAGGLPGSAAKGFSCWVRIEWQRKGEQRWINAYSEVMRLRCDSKDYLFTWRFHISAREREPSSLLELEPSI